MSTARNLSPVSTADQLHVAALGQERVRINGDLIDRGDGYSGRYRNVWLRLRTCGVLVHLTATPDSALGNARRGDRVDVAVTLTGMLDLASNAYYGQRAQLISLQESGSS